MINQNIEGRSLMLP